MLHFLHVLVLLFNCTALSQSESSNYFIYVNIIIIVNVIVIVYYSGCAHAYLVLAKPWS